MNIYMNENEFLGVLIGLLAVIVPLFIACVTPIIKLNKSIQKLNDSIDNLNKSDSKKEAVLDNVMKTLNNHSECLIIDKKRLDNLSRRIKKLDNEEGFIDDKNRY